MSNSVSVGVVLMLSASSCMWFSSLFSSMYKGKVGSTCKYYFSVNCSALTYSDPLTD